MKKNVIEKLLKGEELNALERAELERFDPEAEAAAGRELETRLRDAETERDRLLREREEAETAKLDETEKMRREVEKLTKSLNTAQTERDAVRAEHETLKRRNRVAELAAANACVDPDYLDFRASRDQIDLNDENAAAAFIAGLRASAPNAFRAEIKPGAGGGLPPGGTASDDKKNVPPPTGRMADIIQAISNAPEI